MKKFVTENLQEFMELSEARKSSKAVVVTKTKKEKWQTAIDGLKEELAKAKRKGEFRTTIEKNAKIKELEDKINAFKEKMK